jgi:hypothetical protein
MTNNAKASCRGVPALVYNKDGVCIGAFTVKKHEAKNIIPTYKHP